MILEYLETTGVRDASRRLDQFGRLLAAALPLRNDSNYEALLIAHEYQHVTMTAAFDRLTDAMAEASGWSLPFAIDAFNGFFRRDTDLPADRQEYESLLHHYLHDRIKDAISRKLPCSHLRDKLSDLLRLIDSPPTAAPYIDLESRISRGIFGQKARLMNDFEGRVDDLSRALTNHRSEVI